MESNLWCILPHQENIFPSIFSEVLKGATVRPYGRAKKFRDCARLEFLNKKIHNDSKFYLLWVLFVFFIDVLDYFVCKKLLSRHFGRAKNNFWIIIIFLDIPYPESFLLILFFNGFGFK